LRARDPCGRARIRHERRPRTNRPDAHQSGSAVEWLVSVDDSVAGPVVPFANVESKLSAALEGTQIVALPEVVTEPRVVAQLSHELDCPIHKPLVRRQEIAQI
jgi:hypothetical protein